MVETHKRKKNTVITKITLTISYAKHIKQTLSTGKPYRHQQHLPKISQNVSGAVRMARTAFVAKFTKIC